jgi:hypothetical protein
MLLADPARKRTAAWPGGSPAVESYGAYAMLVPVPDGMRANVATSSGVPA